MKSDNSALPQSVRDGFRSQRGRRFLHAFSLMTLSKILSIAVQLIALPLALANLGTDRYAAFLTLQAFVSWLGLMGLGLGPALPRFIAEGVAQHDVQAQRDLVMSAVVFILSIVLVVATILIALGTVLPLRSLVSASSTIEPSELAAGYRAIVAITCGQLVMTISTALRSGYQELHWSASWASIGNALILGFLIYASRYHLTIATLAMLLYGPVIVLLWLDVAVLFVQRPILFSLHFNFKRFFRLLGAHSANALVMQVSVFIIIYLPTVLVAHIAGPRPTAAYASVMPPLILMMSGLGLITAPLVPAIANAHSQGDLSWIRIAYVRAFAIVLGLSLLVAVSMAVFGPVLFRLWLHKDIGIDRPLCLFMGLYFVAFSSSIFNFNVLAALGNIRGIAWVYLFEAILAQGLGIMLLYRFGLAGMAGGLAIGIGSVTAWYFPRKVWQTLKSKTQVGAEELSIRLEPFG